MEGPVERRLAAILAADAVGYSRLMSADEEATVRLLREHRKLLDGAIAKHQGRIFGTAGDSVIAEFASPVQAVRAAVEAQEALAKRNAGLAEAERMQFRIGLHLGDVMVEGNDLLGDGVNVAARVEGQAPAGGIALSRTIYEQVRAALPLDYRSLGEKTLKNIPGKVEVYAIGGAAPAKRPAWIPLAAAACAVVVVAGAAAWFLRSPTAPPAPAPAASVPSTAPSAAVTPAALPPLTANRMSIAVLPFDNLSGNDEETYFSDGMTEDLITDLSKVSGLLVISRTSSFAYRGKGMGATEVGRALNARYVVEGSVRRAANRLRITAQLIDTATDAHVWAERYDRELKDIFDLQDDVRQKIVAALEVKLAPGERERLARRPTDNVEAYDAWTRGLAMETRFTPEDIKAARRMFLRAIELDPNFARAYGKVAITYANEVNARWAERGPAMEESRRYAEKAVALDPEIPEAYWPLAYAYALSGQLPRALASIKKAIDLNPNYGDALAYQAILLAYDGRAPEAVVSAERAMEVNPQPPHWYFTATGIAYYQSGRFAEAAAEAQKGLDRNPNWVATRRILVTALGQLGRLDDAQWQLDELAAAGTTLTISSERAQSPYRDPKSLELFLDGLRKAGVKE